MSFSLHAFGRVVRANLVAVPLKLVWSLNYEREDFSQPLPRNAAEVCFVLPD